MQRTLCIIKPDGVRRDLIGKILDHINTAGLHVAGTKLIHLSKRQAEKFYAVHAARPFYGELCDYMISAPVLVVALEGENAVERYRKLMGATDPSKADKGTLRAEFALSIGENTVHGSDSLENAAQEVAFFFATSELVNSKI